MSDGRADRAGMPAEGYLVSVPLELEGQVRAQWERRGRGWTARAVYELLRDGFDVVGLRRPPWWRFGTAGRTLTVCAGRKNWRNRGTPIVGAAMPVSSAMLSPRARSKS